jgi:hypothetical protein
VSNARSQKQAAARVRKSAQVITCCRQNVPNTRLEWSFTSECR